MNGDCLKKGTVPGQLGLNPENHRRGTVPFLRQSRMNASPIEQLVSRLLAGDLSLEEFDRQIRQPGIADVGECNSIWIEPGGADFPKSSIPKENRWRPWRRSFTP